MVVVTHDYIPRKAETGRQVLSAARIVHQPSKAMSQNGGKGSPAGKWGIKDSENRSFLQINTRFASNLCPQQHKTKQCKLVTLASYKQSTQC